MKTQSNNSTVFFQGGQWFYKLPDPFRYIAYLPLCSLDISTHLHLSARTALRICKGERVLSTAELLLLQFRFFGYIDDVSFSRCGFYVKNGVMRCHKADNYELSAGDVLEFALLRGYYHNALDSLSLAQKRIKELEGKLTPEPTNIIQFSDFFKR